MVDGWVGFICGRWYGTGGVWWGRVVRAIGKEWEVGKCMHVNQDEGGRRMGTSVNSEVNKVTRDDI